MLQTDRRRDPYPLTWEIPAAVLAVVLLTGALGIHVGRGLANWFAGAGWTWPPARALLTSIPAIAAGDPTAGLATAPVATASASALMVWIVAVEIVLVVVLTCAAVLVLQRWGPGRVRGMATASEAEATLGLSRLRRVRTIIRPDLRAPSPATRSQS